MKAVNQDVQLSSLEEEILAKWKSEGIFEKQNQLRLGAKEFSFYDGPPFANGLPHYGHLLATTIKDTVLRYQVMKGFRVERRFGWDCHGLPVEFEVEKTQNLKGRPDILKIGIDTFNELCRDSVFTYSQQWQETINRMGRWIDWQDQYKTMDKNFMESVWWVFSQLYKKGLIYKSFKIVAYSPRTSSVVSNFEANQNYKQVQDPSITVKFFCKEKNAFFLVWTTTPWTLPSNLALALAPNEDYVVVCDEFTKENYILAQARLKAVYEHPYLVKAGHRYLILETLKGSQLVGLSYEPLFSCFKDHKSAFKVLGAEFVDMQTGTGIVHQAPAYGEDDFYTCQKEGIQLVDPIDENGCFTSLVPELCGTYFKDADKQVIRTLKEHQALLVQDTLVHSYPHDERTDTPLMYKAVPSWYVAVEKIKDDLVANNQKINWVPGHLKDGRMGSWLSQARDWAISRNRFWGTPIPVWICSMNEEHRQVMESVADLEQASGRSFDDIHLHKIKDVKFNCAHCKGIMEPVGHVFDCWFESGSMPYAQRHYPFENKERFASSFPADFIAEGLDQTRGWFYTLSILSTALFNQPAFKNVIVNGIILDEHGKKMSKRHRNYTPPRELMDRFGADAVRLYMMGSSLTKAEDLCFSDAGVKDITRGVILPLWNAYSFLATYAQADGFCPSLDLAEGKRLPEASHKMDRWIISKLQKLLLSVDRFMQTYQLYLVVPELLAFIEDLTNWYIRLSRRRFWGTSEISSSDLNHEQIQAFETLFYVLSSFCKIFAPFAPFISDKIYSCLMDEFSTVPASVHLWDMPKADASLIAEDLEEQMGLLRKVVNLGRSLRQIHKIKVRQALPQMLIILASKKQCQMLQEEEQLIKDELNIKQISFSFKETDHVRLTLKPNLKALGQKLGKNLNLVRTELEKISSSKEQVAQLFAALEQDQAIQVAGFTLSRDDLFIERGPLDHRLIATDRGITVLLDTALTKDLIEEGIARELVNRIQNLRKNAQLNVSDRIELLIELKSAAFDQDQEAARLLLSAVSAHKDMIAKEVLAVSFQQRSEKAALEGFASEETSIDGAHCLIALKKA